MLQSPSVLKSNICFFVPREEQHQPILAGKFDYNEAFAAFLKATNQKAHTANIVGLFVTQLQQKNRLIHGETVKVADLGCADSTACLGYFNQMGGLNEFEYTGVDINDKFLNDADRILSSHPSIKKHTLINSDILLDGLGSIPSEQHHSFDLLFVSHVAYYLQDAHYSLQFMSNIRKLLNKNGMAIFLHEDSTYHFRSTYNSNYKNVNAPKMLRDSAKALVEDPIQFHEMTFTSTLTFEEMTNEQWEAIKNPSLYKKFAHLPGVLDNLNKLSFIVQCDLLKLSEEGSLESFVDEIKALLIDNNYCFDLKTSMQIVVTPENTHTREIEATLTQIKKASPLISQENPSTNPTSTRSKLCYS